MEFNDPKYIEVKLSEEEINALNISHNIIENLVQYMKNKNKTKYYYRDYEGSIPVDITEQENIEYLQHTLWILNRLTDLEGVE